MRSEFLELVRLIKQVITCHRRLRNWNKITAEVKYCVSCWFGFNIQTLCSVQNSGSWLAHWPRVTGYTAWFSCCNDITAWFLCCNELPSPSPSGLSVRSPSELVFEKMADNARMIKTTKNGINYEVFGIQRCWEPNYVDYHSIWKVKSRDISVKLLQNSSTS